MKTYLHPVVALRLRALYGVALTVVCLMAGGCCSQFAFNAVPANRLPVELQGESRTAKRPIDFSLLSQSPPPSYRLGPGDTLAVYVQDILPPERSELPLMQGTFLPNPVYFPANGLLNTPAIGVPVAVQSDGTLPLPLVDPIKIEGMTLQEATATIRKTFTEDNKLLQPGRERVLLTLLRPRVHRVLVLRDDTDGGQQLRTITREESVIARRGSAQAVDLPAFQNDVLHALLATGGLPGVDAYAECWVLHGAQSDFEMTQRQIEMGEKPAELMKRFGATRHIVKVPLRAVPHEPLPFTQDDVILQNGDIVYIETRQIEFFYTGGLLPGGQMPLPRDYDIDVFGAIALATAGVAGPPGPNATNLPIFRSGPGNIIPPTRIIVLRTMPDGEQIKIRVNMNEAMNNPKERLRIQPGDVVMVHYKPHEVVGNTLLNLVTFNITGVFNGNN
jgi:protein involved in polysaccharide export with SLBB domain